ncbi:hypothetical protein BC834DRAFT_826940 [Gloeopeniophorella convolvens]|nr:hypothetical protein BC834DRAFT_826940 [Gloeopeniophorella convolvens]
MANSNNLILVDFKSGERHWLSNNRAHPIEHHASSCSAAALSLFPVTTLDARGRPWCSVLTGAGGRTNFVTHSTCRTELEVSACLWEGDPLFSESGVEASGREHRPPVSGIAVDLGVRRGYRKFAGMLVGRTKIDDQDTKFTLRVDQSSRHCPKYMTIRCLVPCADTRPSVCYDQPDLQWRLPDDVIRFIQEADTVFLGASCLASADAADMALPPYIETSIRGGRPGFMRVCPSDGRTIVLPDFTGNQLITSLGWGDEEARDTLLIALTIVSFTTGDVLYITGAAQRLFGDDACAVMPQQNTLTMLATTGAVLVRSALPLREQPGSTPMRNPYSPPVRPLAEEGAGTPACSAPLRLARVCVHSTDLATFEWELPPGHAGVRIAPGQAAVLDLAPLAETDTSTDAANDDRVRTWTVSSAHDAPTRAFALTIRHKQGGLMSGALFRIAQGCAGAGALRAGLLGFAGAFVLPPPPRRRLLWAAGGVGVTRFLAMLGALVHAREAADVVLVLSTRDPDVLFPLVRSALGRAPPPGLDVRLDVFTTQVAQESLCPADMDVPGLRVQVHTGRITAAHWATVSMLEEREVFVCGPGTFEDAMVESLRCAGAKVGVVHREVFEL